LRHLRETRRNDFPKKALNKNERLFTLFYRMATPSLLALGDSYTIGESVPLYQSFPYQTVQWLRQAGLPIAAPEIIARTGWTTDELAAGMANTLFLPAYDFVSLLIGVNNQYRGRDREEYARQFEELLQEAVRLAGPRSPGEPDSGQTEGAAGPAKRVFVLSIPDWSVTPFAHSNLPDARGRDRVAVAGEIDAFNKTAEEITRKYGSHFLDITEHTRSSHQFAADGLHPSGEEYRYWAERLAKMILEEWGLHQGGQ
jgi:GDSL-like Lipase/Acylhydrolase family